MRKTIISPVDEHSNTPQPATRDGRFTVGDPRRRNGRPLGVPNKVNRPAKALLEAHQEEMAQAIIDLTKKEREGESCTLCGRGMLRNEDTRIRALAEGMDRGGTSRSTQVEVSEAPDTDWMEFATDEELAQVDAIIQRAESRMSE